MLPPVSYEEYKDKSRDLSNQCVMRQWKWSWKSLIKKSLSLTRKNNVLLAKKGLFGNPFYLFNRTNRAVLAAQLKLFTNGNRFDFDTYIFGFGEPLPRMSVLGSERRCALSKELTVNFVHCAEVVEVFTNTVIFTISPTVKPGLQPQLLRCLEIGVFELRDIVPKLHLWLGFWDLARS